jgi:sugar (pentulose or hexulose) kinase
VQRGLVAAVDVGGTGVRAATYRASGRRVGFAARKLAIRQAEGVPNSSEYVAVQAWSAAAEALAEAVGADGGHVEAVGTTAMRLGFALVGAKRELYVGPNSDGRAVAQAIALWKENGPELYRLTGFQPPITAPSVRAAWLAEHKPEVVSEARHLLSLEGWLAWRLTGSAAAEPSGSSASGLFDVTAGSWSERLCALAGVEASLLPPVLRAGEAVGRVRRGAAARTGLRVGTPVTLGGGDTHAGLVGLGALDAGSLGVIAGSTMPVMAVAERRFVDQVGRCWSSPHPVSGRWVLESNTGEAGTALDWLAGLLGVSPTRVGALSASAPAGATGTRALFGPAPIDWGNFPIIRRGVLSFPLPASGIGRPEVARAFVDGLAISVRLARDWLSDVVPLSGPVRLGGGLSKLRTFPEALADATGSPVLVASDPDVTIRGAAAAAAVAAGWHADLAEAGAALGARVRQVEPSHGELYERLAGEWEAELDRLGWTGLRALL